jgi:bacterioferritin
MSERRRGACRRRIPALPLDNPHGYNPSHAKASPERITNMNKPGLIEALNRAISLELAAVIQYNHYANTLTGADRRVWHELFEDMSEGGLKDARKFGFRVAVLGGTPTIEPAPVKLASNITEMLTKALEHERALVQAYTDALAECSDHPAYRNLIEEQIQHEHDEVEELLVYLNKVERAGAAATPAARRNRNTA